MSLSLCLCVHMTDCTYDSRSFPRRRQRRVRLGRVLRVVHGVQRSGRVCQ